MTVLWQDDFERSNRTLDGDICPFDGLPWECFGISPVPGGVPSDALKPQINAGYMLAAGEGAGYLVKRARGRVERARGTIVFLAGTTLGCAAGVILCNDTTAWTSPEPIAMGSVHGAVLPNAIQLRLYQDGVIVDQVTPAISPTLLVGTSYTVDLLISGTTATVEVRDLGGVLKGTASITNALVPILAGVDDSTVVFEPYQPSATFATDRIPLYNSVEVTGEPLVIADPDPLDRTYEFTNSEGDILYMGRYTNIRVLEVTGLLDMPDKTQLEVQATDRDGGYSGGDDYLGIRRVALSLAGDCDSDAEAEALVDEMQGIFAHGRREGVFAFKRVGKDPRQIFARVKRSAIAGNWDLATGLVKAAVEMVAVDPRVYSYELQTQVVGPAIDAVGRTYPRTYPLSYGSAGSGGLADLVNEGTIDTFPTFVIQGPAVNPVIRHLSSGKFLEFNITIIEGEFLEIDTRTHAVLLGGTANRRALMTNDSRWFALSPGSNEIRFGVNGADTPTQLEATWRHAWPNA